MNKDLEMLLCGTDKEWQEYLKKLNGISKKTSRKLTIQR
jgi:hypothetical protein